MTSEIGERDIDAIIRQVQQQMPEVKVTQLRKIHPADDDNLWYFCLSDVEQWIQIENPACPFLVETDEQWGKKALKATTVDEAVTMIAIYLKSVKEGQTAHLVGDSYWSKL